MTRRHYRRHLRRLLAIAALLTMPFAAKADVVKWGETAGWNISVDRPSSSCGMTRTFSRGTTISVVFHRPTREFSLSVGNEAWSDIKHDANYSIRVVMDGHPWKASFVGVANGQNKPFLFVNGLKREFLTDFMKRNTIEFYNATSGEKITGMTLAGSTAAMGELVECQRAMNDTTPMPTKPQAQTFTQ